MADLQHQTSKAPAKSAPPPVQESASPNLQPRGNAAMQEKMASGDQSAGKMNWQNAMGETVGGKLYDALSGQLTDDKLLGHANKAVNGAMSSLKKYLSGNVQANEQEAAALFVAELDKSMRGVAQEAVVKSGLSEGIRDVVDANPYSIALAAIAGAVAYVLSNQDLPVIETKLGLGGGHSLLAGVDPGRTMQLALEQVRVGYKYSGDKLAASLILDKYKDGYAANGKVEFTPSADTSLALSGSHSDRDGTKKSSLDLSYRDPNLVGSVGAQRQTGAQGDQTSISASLANRAQPGELQKSIGGTWRDNGSWEATAGISQQKKDSSWSIEAFGGQDAGGNSDYGVRALYRLRF
jgi:hypothetical protein